ncbi:lpdA [Wigglesworthia glossinidia endosymbiont of Glossina brevipalpis]|uniref:Dihydrolipoyl dehydrogenase n=1 Tax=Wigglesworthia glossinidia brevipalpis TaxID=36870 RepID=Q8D2N3_WIGBR|nr:lpdA [Wigglesworthia glossinidia endosymbiont of Glossina brevipalpis]
MKENKINTEVLVIGSGPGGYSAAFRCADLGLKTVLVERFSSLGGVCLNVGCIPSKSLLHIANNLNSINKLKKIGIKFNEREIDMNQIRKWKCDVVLKLTNGLNMMSKARNVKIIHGYGEFIDPYTVNVKSLKENTKIKFEHAIIAVGSSPIKNHFMLQPDEKIWDSTDALKIKFIPKKLLIVGGGVIGLEMATVYNSFGSEVYIAEMSNQLIPAVDTDIINIFYKSIKNNFNIMLNTELKSVYLEDNNIYAELVNNDKKIEKICCNAVLFSTGRKSNGDLIKAKEIGIKLNNLNFIEVNNQMRTNIPHIYAIGDVTGHPMLAHKASYQSHIAAEVISGENHFFDPRVIPSVAYTNPEISWVGITEKEAINLNIPYETALFPWNALGRAIASDHHEGGMTKLIFNKENKKIIGGSIVGYNSSELLGEISLAIEMGCDVDDISLTIHAHPTLYESIGRASEIFSGTITDFLNKKSKNK